MIRPSASRQMPFGCPPRSPTRSSREPSAAMRVHTKRPSAAQIVPSRATMTPSHPWRSRPMRPRARCESRPALPPARHRPVHLAPLHARADRRAFVVELLPLPETQLRLRSALRPVQAERDQRQAALLHPAAQVLEFLAVHEQLPRAHRVVTELARRPVGADVRAHQEELLAEEARVGILQLRAVVAQRLDLAAGQHQPGLEALEDVVVVKGPAVLRDVPLAGLLRHPAALSGISARFSRTRFCASTKTTFGSCARAASSSSQVKAAMMTRSPGRTRCAAAPFTHTTPESGRPSTA